MRFYRKGRTFSRSALDSKLKETLPRLSAPRVLDLGSKRAPYRQWVTCNRYDCMDLVISNQPDIVGDGHRIPIRDESYDAVIATQVLEHCHTPPTVVREVHRILRPGGVFVVSVPFVYVIHGDPHDFWRFTEYAVRHVLEPFDEVELSPLGNRFTCVWDLLSGHMSALRYLNRVLSPLVSLMDANPRCPHGYFAIARKVMPSVQDGNQLTSVRETPAPNKKAHALPHRRSKGKVASGSLVRSRGRKRSER